MTGTDLLLEGRFKHWMPVAMMGDKPGTGIVQLLLDSTSPANEGGQEGTHEDLLFFSGTEVRRIGDNAFAAKGTLQAGEARGEVEVVVQTPEGHTPFFFVTVPIDRRQFAELWTQIEDRALSSFGQQKEMRPMAWFRAPDLAAA